MPPPSSGAYGAEMRGEPGDPRRGDGGCCLGFLGTWVSKGPLKGAAGCLLRAWALGGPPLLSLH